MTGGEREGAAFLAHFSPRRRLLGIAGCAGFVALGLWIAGAISGIDRPAPPIGWACVIFFGGGGLLLLARVTQRGPALRIDADGIWRWTRGGGALVRWDAVARMEEVRIRRQRFLAIWLAEGGRDPIRTAAFGAAPFGDVSVGVQGTDGQADAMFAAVDRFRPG